MRTIRYRILAALFATGLFYLPAVSTAHASAPDLNGKWIGYYDDGSKSEYVWAIHQKGSTLSIENVGGQTAKSKGHVEGNKVVAEDFATQNGKLSADGTQIKWTDGVVWKRAGAVSEKLTIPNLTGKWIGYYNDGTKSEYVWAIHQTGSNLTIENVGGGKAARSKGRIEDNQIVASDFATKNGKVSNDGTQIKWSDGVRWDKR